MGSTRARRVAACLHILSIYRRFDTPCPFPAATHRQNVFDALSRGPLVFDKLLLGSIGLSNAVYDAVAVPQQQRISQHMLQPRPLAHQMLMLPRVTLQHSATERDCGGTGQTQTPGHDPINLQLRLRLSTFPELYYDLFRFEGYITSWVETQKKLKRRQALQLATQSQERWTTKGAEWNPGLIISPAKKLEDDLNDEFVKDEKTEATQSKDLRIIIRGVLLRKTSTNGKRKKDNTLNTLITIEESNPTPINNTTSPATTPPH